MEPLDPKAIPEIKVNGKPLTSMEPFKLRPNDRICIGPSALFLFKNVAHENEASMPDTPEDPITFDFADEEVNDQDADQQAQITALAAQQVVAKESAVKEFEESLNKEEAAKKNELQQIQQEIEQKKNGTEEEKKAAESLEKTMQDKQQELLAFNATKIKKLMAEKLKQSNSKFWEEKTKTELKKLVPFIKEANKAAETMKRLFVFSVQMMREFNPNTQTTSSKIQLIVRVNNNENTMLKYHYDWNLDKFHNRLGLIRDMLDDFLDDGILQRYGKDNDPFWDPPAPRLIGSVIVNMANFCSPQPCVNKLQINGMV